MLSKNLVVQSFFDHFTSFLMSILLLSILHTVCSAMVPISPSETLNELESLLHFAIRHSDPSKLHELASNRREETMSPQEVSEMMEAMYSSETHFTEAINRTIIYREFDSDADLMTSLDFIEDFGDHLLDKGDLLHGLGALEKLVEWVLTSSASPVIHKRLTDLLVSVTQNREPTKKLVLELFPNISTEIFQILSSNYKCEENDQVCASLVSLITAIIGGNEGLVQRIDKSVISPLAENLNSVDPKSKFFARILTLMKVVTICFPNSQWMTVVDIERFLGLVGSVNISLGERILDLMPSRDRSAYARIYSQCITVREVPDSCSRYKLDSHDEL